MRRRRGNAYDFRDAIDAILNDMLFYSPKRGKKKPGRKKKAPARKPKPFGFFELIPVDTENVKRQLIEDWQKIQKRFGKSQEKLDGHRKNDIPAFERWHAKVFGVKLTESRGLHEKIAEKSSLAHVVESQSMLLNKSPGSFFRELEALQASGMTLADALDKICYKPPERKNQEEDSDFEGDFKDGDDFRAFFEDEDYESLNEEEREYLRDFEREIRDFYGEDDSADIRDFKLRPETPKTAGALRDLYRKICRRLHPDTGCEFNEENSRLWHIVQEAYETGDLERLEACQAELDMRVDPMSKSVTCSQILALTGELEDGLRSVKSMLGRARSEPSWNFTVRTDREKNIIASRIGKALDYEINRLKGDLTYWERVFEGWRKAPSGRPRSAPPPKPKKEKPPADPDNRQMTFDF